MNILTISTSNELELLVRTHIEAIARHKESGPIRIGLPGGRSAKHLIQGILGLENPLLGRLRLYLLDERLSGELNSDTLLEAGLDKAIGAKRFAKNNLVMPQVGRPLLENKTDQFDLIYLGIGEDGHMASLFPGSYPGTDTGQTSFVGNSPKPPSERVTFTYQGFLDHAHNSPIYLLFLGEGKREALKRLLSGKETAETLPCAFFTQQDFPVTIITDIEE